jgi:HKD family nuclease
MSAAGVFSLADVFSDIFSSIEKDPLEHIAILSYEFDDQQVLNLALQKPLAEHFDPRILHFAQIAETVPIVIYDARKTREHNRLPHFMELLAVKKPVWSCHHSKAYLVVTKIRVHLILGSMNLTASGLFTNREVFESYSWAAGDTQDLQLLAQFVSALEKGYSSFASGPLESALATVRRRLDVWHGLPMEGPSTLVHQGYDEQSGLEALSFAWTRQFGKIMPDRCIAVSPFYDRGTTEAVFARSLSGVFPSLQHLDVVTDETVLAVLSRRHFDAIPRARVFAISKEMQLPERARISAANGGVDVSALVLTRKLHAKVLALSRGENSLVYIGSANFTQKAWTGSNHEMGIARPYKQSAEQLLPEILTSLGASAIDRFDGLPDTPPDFGEDPSEDEYQELSAYPEFVLGIELIESEVPEMMRFRIAVSDDSHRKLVDYQITWGRHEIRFSEGISQELPQQLLLSCLLGGRNLCFAWQQDLLITFFLPFRHAPGLFAKRDRFVFPTAEDWMLHYLGVESTSWRQPDEYLPGDAAVPEDDPTRRMMAARNGNPVIRVQQHLNLFSRVEAEFTSRAQTVLTTPETEQSRLWETQVAGPLATFARVLLRSRLDQEGLFKLGELILFVRTLRRTSMFAQPLLTTLLKSLPQSSNDPVTDEYLTYCHRETS